MEYKLNQEYKILGKLENINEGSNFCNINVATKTGNVNIKLEKENLSNLQLGKLYSFQILVEERPRREDIILVYVSHKDLEDDVDEEIYDDYVTNFYEYAPKPLGEIKKEIEVYLNKIDNKILKDITLYIYNKYKANFYTHPAATKFHHAYVGGLSYHTLTMLYFVEPMIKIYPYLNKDLLISGIILHDVNKIDEISGVDGEYTKEGQLIGHLVGGALDVELAAKELGYSDTEEVLLLKHIILSHHGLLHFGSPKKPQIAEALLIWYIDTIDSKFLTLGEELDKIEKGEFTESVRVLDKMRFYKPKL